LLNDGIDTRLILYFKYDPTTLPSIEFSKIFTKEDGLIMGKDGEFEEDNEGNIWYVNSSFNIGMSIYNGRTWKYQKLNGENSFISISNVFDKMWIGEYGILHVCDNGKWKVYKKPINPFPSSKIFVFKDSKDYLWIGGIDGELIRIDYSQKKWSFYKHLNFQCEDKHGNSWFIEVGGKVVVKKPSGWFAYQSDDGLPDAPVRIFCTRDGLVCAAGSYKGKASISFLTNAKWHRQTYPELSWGIEARAIFEDNNSNLWLGGCVNFETNFGEKGGCLKIHNPGKTNQTTTHYIHGDSMNLATIYGINQTNDGTIWLGGAYLSRFRKGQWEQYSEINELNHYINCMANSPEGSLWVGSRQYGVFRYKDKKWTTFNTDSSLNSNTINGLLVKNDSDVWVATSMGISHYDGKSWANNVFSDEFTLSREGGDLLSHKDGSLWINKSSRAWKRRALYNNEVDNEDTNVFSAFLYKPNTNGPRSEIVVYSNEVPSTGNTYIEWKGIDAWNETPASELQFSYRLNGGEWSSYAKKNNLTLTNLKDGDFTFEVRARDMDFNIEPMPAKITFVVQPPVWKQSWFIMLVILIVFVVSIYQFILLSQKKHLVVMNKMLTHHGEEIERKNLILESQKEEILRQIIKEKEATQSKISFFTNISHEFRTPLTLILGIIDILSKKTLWQESASHIAVLKRNANNLLELINQLLNFRKLEEGEIELVISQVETVSFIKDTCDSFAAISKKYGIDLAFITDIEELHAWLDVDKIQKILYNLLSNAIKFTSEEGQIRVKLEQISHNRLKYLQIIVEDTGKGIPESEIDKIFDPFYQVASSLDNSISGTGIGLSIVRKYVKIHMGKLEIISSTNNDLQKERGYSTRFQAVIPLDHSVYEGCKILKLENVMGSLEGTIPYDRNIHDEQIDCGQSGYFQPTHIGNKKSLLIVEDNEDLRRYLTESLNDKFKLMEAGNGLEAFDLTTSYMPDIIVCDVMMPKMTGSEFCSKIKSDLRTCHIPVIFITALTNDESQMEGYNVGADAYVTKPFNMNLLIAQIENLLLIRDKLKKKFINEEMVKSEDVSALSLDAQLLHKLKVVMEYNYANPQFGVEELSKLVGLSSRHLLHKMKNLMGQSPVDYIREFRLKKAAKMLVLRKGSISEIAFETGFNDLSYFGKCFAKHYNMKPSEYMKNASNQMK
jgi:signal transduction histidine kinase/CheY-like chemotaxis protein/AraC-like DNA-binding protein